LLTISILWIWNSKLGNFNCQTGNRACENSYGDIVVPHTNSVKLSKMFKKGQTKYLRPKHFWKIQVPSVQYYCR